MSEENALARQEDGDDELAHPSPISLDVSKLSPQRASIVVSQITQHARFAKNALTNIANAPETTEYVLRIPRQIQEGLDSGDLKLMTKKTGEMVGDVMGRSEKSGRMVVQHKLEAEQRTVKSITPSEHAEALSSDLFNIAIQQQMAEISAQLDEVLDAAKRIEQGQQDDRYALIESAESQLRLAAVAEDEANRLEHVRSAQHFLQEGSKKIARAMSRRIDNADEVPEFPPAIIWKMLSSRGNYYDTMTEWFNKAQEDFDVLEKAYAMLALCAVAIDEPNMLDVLLDDYKTALKAMDTRKLLSMGRLHTEAEFDGTWFSDVEGYIETRREEAKLLTDGQYIEVTMTGRMLMEAIDDETGEGPGEEGTEEDEPV